jgi:hypothetical protein
MRHRPALRRLLPVLVIPAFLAAAACDIVTADYRSEETAQWQKTYPLAPDGQVEIENTNGKILVEPSSGNTVEVTAIKKAKGSSPEAAKAALERITFAEDVSPNRVRVQTKIEKQSGAWFSSGLQVEYHVKVPQSAQVKFTNVNGAIEMSDLKGRINAETTNGEVRGRNIAGAIEASTTNGGLDVDLAEVPAGGVKLECTNGGIRLHLPKDGKATISARITNGGISANGLSIESTESSRRRLDGTLNGGGPRVDIDGTNGGITLSAR